MLGVPSATFISPYQDQSKFDKVTAKIGNGAGFVGSVLTKITSARAVH